MAELPTTEDMRLAGQLASRWALRSLMQTLFVDRCMGRPDPNAAAKELLARERDAMDGIAAPAVRTVDGDILKHMVLDEIETLLQSVAGEVALRVESNRPPT